MDLIAAARAADANEAEFFAAFGRGPGCRLVDVDGALLVETGDLGFARVLTTSVSDDLFGEVLDRCRSLLGSAVRLEWVVGYEYSPTDLGARLSEAGFRRTGSMPAMAVEIDALPEWQSLGPPGLRIDRIVSSEDLDDRLVPVLAAHFGPESNFLNAILGAYRAVGFEDDALFAHMVGSVGDGPVEVVGTAWVAGGAIGLGAIATLKESRGRGLGSAMTSALATSDLGSEVDISVLHATPMGRPVYERLGYQTVFDADFYKDEGDLEQSA